MGHWTSPRSYLENQKGFLNHRRTGIGPSHSTKKNILCLFQRKSPFETHFKKCYSFSFWRHFISVGYLLPFPLKSLELYSQPQSLWFVGSDLVFQ